MTNTKTAFAKKVKRMSRKAPVRIVALVLMVALVMNVSSVVTLLPVFAGNNTSATVQSDSPTASVTNDDLQISGSNSFGNLLATKVNDYQNGANEDENTEGYSVIGIEMNGKTATVEYNAVENCMLVVGVYTEDGVKMLGSGNTTVSPDEESTNVEIAISEMPQYYLVKAFLVNPVNNYTLCKVYTCELYTEAIQYIKNSEMSDFGGRKMLNLDNDNATNFAVYDLGVHVIREMDDSNIYNVSSSNPAQGKYVFEKVDSDFASMQAGDIFSHEDGSDNVIIGKVASISAVDNGDGTYTVTIIGDANLDMEDVFDYVKIDIDEDYVSYTLDDSVADPCVSVINEPSPSPLPMSGAKDVTGKKSIDFSREIKKDMFTFTAKFSMTLSVHVYISLGEDYVEVSFEEALEVSGEIKGKIADAPVIKLPAIGAVLCPGVIAEIAPAIKIKADVKITFSLKMSSKPSFKYSTKSGFSGSKGNSKVELSCSIEGSLFIGLDLEPRIKILDEKIAQVSAKGSFGVTIKGEIKVKASSGEQDDSSKHLCTNTAEGDACIDGDYNLKLSLSVGVKFLNKHKLDAKVLDLSWKLGDWYYSIKFNDHSWTKPCPHTGYKVTFRVKDQNDTVLKDVSIFDANDMNTELAKTDETGTAITYLEAKKYNFVAVVGDKQFPSKEITVKKKENQVSVQVDIDSNTDPNNPDDPDDPNNPDNPIIDDWTFDENTGLLTINTDVGMRDFSCDSGKVKSIIINKGVTFIGNSAFSDYSNLTSITILDSVTSIGEKAFRYCSSLASITIPSSVTSIGIAAFIGCRSLTSINVSVDNKYFTSAEGILFNKDITTLIACPCNNGSATIPSSVTSIGAYAFWGCSGLTTITIPNSVTYIGDYAFSCCSSLNNITIPNSVTYIGDSAFASCISLTTITIPNSVTYIGSGSFYFCMSLTSISIPNSVTSIEEGTFSSCYRLANITIPNSIISIGASAFWDCGNLKSITIPNSVTSLGTAAFLGSGLTNIAIPSSVTSIGEDAFSKCSNLRRITIPNSVTSIGNMAFSGCSSLTSIIIPNSLTSISGYLFRNCTSLTSIAIPNTVTSIGWDAFKDCKNLTDVYYTGTQEEWENISILDDNTPLTSATIHYNTTGPASSPTPMRSPDVSGALSATFDNLIPNANYLFVVSKSSNLDNMLDASNLLFIDEKTAGDSGSLTFNYIPREDYEGAVVKIFGPVNPSVKLNITSASLKKGEKIQLTATVDFEHSTNDVVWLSSNGEIATVSKGQVTAVGFGDAEISAKLDDCVVKCVVSVVPDLDFTILGASIRLSEPYGIRFGIQLGKGGDYANVKIVEYGTLMKPTQLLGDEELTLQTAKIQKIPAKVIYSETDAAQVYTGVLINIPTTYFDTAISGCGYFIYEDENGLNHTIYTDTVSMSFNDVVEAAYNKYSKLTNPTDAQKVVLQKLETLRALNGNN